MFGFGMSFDNSGAARKTTGVTNFTAPVISGSPVQGQTLSSTTGTWGAGGKPLVYTYQWQGNGVNIGGATSSTYVLTATEVGKLITCVVTATTTNGSQSGSATSNSLGPVT